MVTLDWYLLLGGTGTVTEGHNKALEPPLIAVFCYHDEERRTIFFVCENHAHNSKVSFSHSERARDPTTKSASRQFLVFTRTRPYLEHKTESTRECHPLTFLPCVIPPLLKSFPGPYFLLLSSPVLSFFLSCLLSSLPSFFAFLSPHVLSCLLAFLPLAFIAIFSFGAKTSWPLNHCKPRPGNPGPL